ncbi:hypothetical protein [Dyella choica]|uniref:Uncharacterized protein n=1 Tax=Dyella choica TaxID=1927959 RepID=A0A432M5D2_9GAMM|nr:hypothetical protein [Dyella choica]RUL74956.1 hypothetical protein EKH80_12820 [Dyella choica]
MDTSKLKHPASSLSNYQLKTTEMIDRSAVKQWITASAPELDKARTSARPVPASKFSLEGLCGASGAIGAF